MKPVVKKKKKKVKSKKNADDDDEESEGEGEEKEAEGEGETIVADEQVLEFFCWTKGKSYFTVNYSKFGSKISTEIV